MPFYFSLLKGEKIVRGVSSKFLGALLTLFLSSIVLFVLIRQAPGDPITLLLEQPGDLSINDASLLEERKQELRELHGLNDNVFVQYKNWFTKVLRLDLGTSIWTGRSVAQEITTALKATLILAFAALVIQVVLGIGFGILSAVRAGGFKDNVIRLLCVMLASVPGFVLSLSLVYFFAVRYRIYEMSSDINLYRVWLPAMAAALTNAPRTIRVVRATSLTEMGQAYTLFSKSCGVSKRIIIRDIVRNSLLPIITVISISLVQMIGGAIVIESIFSWPGIGSYAVNAIMLHDYPAIQGYSMVTVTAIILTNLMVDVLYILVDPRLKSAPTNG
mgnify:CR=1 FL=1|jgi:peptide/nickel transport system permease protein